MTRPGRGGKPLPQGRRHWRGLASRPPSEEAWGQAGAAAQEGRGCCHGHARWSGAELSRNSPEGWVVGTQAPVFPCAWVPAVAPLRTHVRNVLDVTLDSESSA